MARPHDSNDCVICWAGVDHEEPEVENEAVRIINLRVGFRAILAVSDPNAARQIALDTLKRDNALGPRSLARSDIIEALTRNLNRAGVEPTVETYNQILRDLGFDLDD